MFVKICGMNSPEAVEAAVEAGVDALGFVFAESPRQVTPEQANALCASVPPHIARIAVMRHPHKEHWERVVETFEPNWLQTDAEDFKWIKLPASCRRCPSIATATRRPTRDLPGSAAFRRHAERQRPRRRLGRGARPRARRRGHPRGRAYRGQRRRRDPLRAPVGRRRVERRRERARRQRTRPRFESSSPAYGRSEV